MKKPTLTQVMIEAIVTKSQLYQDLKKENDINVECITHLNTAVSELMEAVEKINGVLQNYSTIIKEYEAMFHDMTEQFHEENEVFELAHSDKLDKSKLN